VVGGFETSAATAGWCLYTAAAHLEWQERVVAELTAAGLAGPGARPLHSLTHDALVKASPALDALIQETMRLYPTAATSASRVTTDPSGTPLGPYTLPPGIVIWAPQYLLHNSTSLWDNPSTFKPERWLGPEGAAAQYAKPGAGTARSGTDNGAPSGNGGEQQQYKRYMPFGEGIKNCVGQAYGQALVRTLVGGLLSRLRFSLPPGFTSPERGNVVVAITTKMAALQLDVTPRE